MTHVHQWVLNMNVMLKVRGENFYAWTCACGEFKWRNEA